MQTIYSLEDPRNGEVRYIGVTNNLSARVSNHLVAKNKSWVCSWIRRLRRMGLKPRVVVLEKVEDRQREDSERAWILGFRQAGAKLTNLTDGGEGSPGHKVSKETREKIRLAHKGRIRSAEWCRNLSIALTGRKRPPMSMETKRRQSETHKKLALVGDQNPQAKISNARRRNIVMMCAQGVSQARVARIFGLHYSYVSLLIRGKRCGGLDKFMVPYN